MNNLEVNKIIISKRFIDSNITKIFQLDNYSLIKYLKESEKEGTVQKSIIAVKDNKYLISYGNGEQHVKLANAVSSQIKDYKVWFGSKKNEINLYLDDYRKPNDIELRVITEMLEELNNYDKEVKINLSSLVEQDTQWLTREELPDVIKKINERKLVKELK